MDLIRNNARFTSYFSYPRHYLVWDFVACYECHDCFCRPKFTSRTGCQMHP